MNIPVLKVFAFEGSNDAIPTSGLGDTNINVSGVYFLGTFDNNATETVYVLPDEKTVGKDHTNTNTMSKFNGKNIHDSNVFHFKEDYTSYKSSDVDTTIKNLATFLYNGYTDGNVDYSTPATNTQIYAVENATFVSEGKTIYYDSDTTDGVDAKPLTLADLLKSTLEGGTQQDETLVNPDNAKFGYGSPTDATNEISKLSDLFNSYLWTFEKGTETNDYRDARFIRQGNPDDGFSLKYNNGQYDVEADYTIVDGK